MDPRLHALIFVACLIVAVGIVGAGILPPTQRTKPGLPGVLTPLEEGKDFNTSLFENSLVVRLRGDLGVKYVVLYAYRGEKAYLLVKRVSGNEVEVRGEEMANLVVEFSDDKVGKVTKASERFLEIFKEAKLRGVQRCPVDLRCLRVCPAGAIELRRDEKGRVLPFVDEERCVRCGLCRLCPQGLIF